MIAIGFEKYGSQEELEKDAIKHLFDVYVKVNADAANDPKRRVAALRLPGGGALSRKAIAERTRACNAPKRSRRHTSSSSWTDSGGQPSRRDSTS